MIDIRFKKFFFDRQSIVAAVTSSTRAVLSKFGAFVRSTAKQSIRTRKRASAPGQPPSSHVGTLKRLIFFGYDPRRKSVVIGPEAFTGKMGTAVAPPVLEYGGRTRVRSRRRLRTVGGVGEIRLDGPGGGTTKPALDWRGKKRRVAYAAIRTARQAARANLLNEELYGPAGTRTVTIGPRPFMHPALAAEIPQLPGLWAGAVKP